jgi:hypothetical protein
MPAALSFVNSSPTPATVVRVSKAPADEAVLVFARALVERWKDGGRTFEELAEKIERSGGYVSQLKDGKAGMSLPTAMLFARVHGWSLGSFVDRAERWHASKGTDFSVFEKTYVERDPSERPIYSNLPSWPAALASAKSIFRNIPADVWDAVGRSSPAEFPQDGVLDAGILLKLAEAVLAMRNAPRKTEAEVQAEIDADEPLEDE